jgi:hypothetical protein
MAYRIGKLILSPSSEYFGGNQIIVGDPAYVATAGNKITMDDPEWYIDTNGFLKKHICAIFFGSPNVIYYDTLQEAFDAPEADGNTMSILKDFSCPPIDETSLMIEVIPYN